MGRRYFVLLDESTQILSCWKDIAKFFGKGIRTVQRWEHELGMPVHRPSGDRNVVFADPEELRRWAFGIRSEADNEAAAPSSKRTG